MTDLRLPKWPEYQDDEIDSVRDVLSSGKVNYWTGDICNEFEVKFSQSVGCNFGIALANGTLALELALKSLKLKSGDEVIVPARSYFATAAAVVNVGAKPVFADIELETQNLSLDTISKAISPNTKALICVHLSGLPCDMPTIQKFAKQKKLFVIEDCAQAHGASVNGRSVGSFGDVSCWSFCQDKIMSTGGEGGMVTTNNEDFYFFMRSYKDHGKNFAKVLETQGSSNATFKWVHDGFGSNYRMTEMQAAIGLKQLSKLKTWVRKRRANATLLVDAVGDLPWLGFPKSDLNFFNSRYRLFGMVQHPKSKNQIGRDMVLSRFREFGLPCFQGTCPEIYLEKSFVDNGLRPKQRLKNASELSSRAIMFLVHHNLCDESMERYSNALVEAIASLKDDF